jgi:hypothetical protein
VTESRSTARIPRQCPQAIVGIATGRHSLNKETAQQSNEMQSNIIAGKMEVRVIDDERDKVAYRR